MKKETTLTILAKPLLEPNGRKQPLMHAPVRAGFPSPADDYRQPDLDLHRHLVKHPASTFFLYVSGDSMQGYGIFDGDLLVVDRSLTPSGKEIVIAAIDGELTCKRLVLQKGKAFLESGHEEYAPIGLKDLSVHIWGVVTHSIHTTYPAKRVD